MNNKNILNTVSNTWNTYGNNNNNIYWSVISNNKYKTINSQEQLDEFYKSGIESTNYIKNKFEKYKKIFELWAIEKRCLDFGCGCGRTLIHLAMYFDEIVGMDISQGHLDKANNIAKQLEISNIKLYKSDEDITIYDNFDLIYSVIVLQHIPPPLMKNYINQLLSILNDDGYAFLHIPIKSTNNYICDENNFSNEEIIEMQMYYLDINVIKKIISDNNCILLEFDDKQNHCGTEFEDGFFIIKKSIPNLENTDSEDIDEIMKNIYIKGLQ